MACNAPDSAAKMIELGPMTEHGEALVELAKTNGTWQVLPDAESSAIPADLQASLDRNLAARKNFHKFPPSSKRLILEGIATARKPETRRRRIDETVALAAVYIPSQPRSLYTLGRSSARPQWSARTAISTPNAATTRIAAAAIEPSRSPPWNWP